MSIIHYDIAIMQQKVVAQILPNREYCPLLLFFTFYMHASTDVWVASKDTGAQEQMQLSINKKTELSS